MLAQIQGDSVQICIHYLSEPHWPWKMLGKIDPFLPYYQQGTVVNYIYGRVKFFKIGDASLKQVLKLLEKFGIEKHDFQISCLKTLLCISFNSHRFIEKLM